MSEIEHPTTNPMTWPACPHPTLYARDIFGQPSPWGPCLLCSIDRLTAERDAAEKEVAELKSALYDEQAGITATLRNDERDALKAENERLREALVTVRTSLHCTKRAPFEYDADHYCGDCGSSSGYAKDVIDEALGEQP